AGLTTAADGSRDRQPFDATPSQRCTEPRRDAASSRRVSGPHRPKAVGHPSRPAAPGPVVPPLDGTVRIEFTHRPVPGPLTLASVVPPAAVAVASRLVVTEWPVVVRGEAVVAEHAVTVRAPERSAARMADRHGTLPHGAREVHHPPERRA